jgi:phage antirepressor YoqD-like protein
MAKRVVVEQKDTNVDNLLEGSCSFKELAKSLEIKKYELLDWLLDQDVLATDTFMGVEYLRPCQVYVDKGLLTAIPQEYFIDFKGKYHPPLLVRVTEKGIAYFKDKIIREYM